MDPRVLRRTFLAVAGVLVALAWLGGMLVGVLDPGSTFARIGLLAILVFLVGMVGLVVVDVFRPTDD